MAILTFEGLDGSGKTTIIEKLKTILTDRGYDVLAIRQPGGGVLGETLRDILKSKDIQLSPINESILLAACRQEAVEQIKEFKPSLKDKRVVLIDRWTLSYFYQMAAVQTQTEDPVERTRQEEEILTILKLGNLNQIDTPSKMILINRSETLKKNTKTYDKEDRFESDRERMELVAKMYSDAMSNTQDSNDTKVYVNNHKSAPEEIATNIANSLDKGFKLC